MPSLTRTRSASHKRQRRIQYFKCELTGDWSCGRQRIAPLRIADTACRHSNTDFVSDGGLSSPSHVRRKRRANRWKAAARSRINSTRRGPWGGGVSFNLDRISSTTSSSDLVSGNRYEVLVESKLVSSAWVNLRRVSVYFRMDSGEGGWKGSVSIPLRGMSVSKGMPRDWTYYRGHSVRKYRVNWGVERYSRVACA